MSSVRTRGARLRTARLAALVGVALAIPACAGIPDSGVIHVGRAVPAPGGLGDIDVRVLPAAAQPGLAPNDVLHGFLRALVSSDGNYDIARTYLSHHAAATWRPAAGVTTYDDSSVQIADVGASASSRSLQLKAPRLGEIDERGNFAPVGGTMRVTYGLTKQSGQWRIDRLSNGVLLSALDVQRAFRPAVVYYLNRTATTLVPEQVFLRPAPGVTTALVRALVDGPGDWLAPSVRTGFPSGTVLLGNVPVDPTGVAEVNLSSSVRQATAAELNALSAQLAWTLRQVSDVSAVRILVEGAPLAVPEQPINQPVNSWPAVNPAPAPPSPIAAYAHDGGWRVIGSSATLASAAGLSDLAISFDGTRIAALSDNGPSMSLLVGRRGQQLSTRVTARSLATPTFDATGTVFVVAQRSVGQAVVAVPTDGPVQRIGTSPELSTQPIQRLALSHDGARVAAVVGDNGRARLLVGRVVVVRAGSQTRLRFEGFRDLLRGAADIRGLSWDGGDQILTTVAVATGGRELIAVDVDGYGTRTIPTTTIAGQPIDVAAATDRPILVTAGGGVWRNDSSGAWTRLGNGDQPVYPG